MEVLTTLVNGYGLQILLTVLALVLFFLISGYIYPKLEEYVVKGRLKSTAFRKALYLFRVLYGVVILAIMLFIWGFDFKWLFALSTGIIALTGVALFANWSVLSNVTAFFILIIHESYKRGTVIRVIEGENYVEGVISQINVFNTSLLTDKREYIIYPNNLLIARPTVINPKTRHPSVGKIQDLNPKTDPVPASDEEKVKT